MERNAEALVVHVFRLKERRAMLFGAVDPGLLAVFAAILGPAGAYLVAVRQLSGKIKNSEASELWEESRSIREWSTARVKELNEHIRELEARVDELEAENRQLKAQVGG
jgi:hypothetical protein